MHLQYRPLLLTLYQHQTLPGSRRRPWWSDDVGYGSTLTWVILCRVIGVNKFSVPSTNTTTDPYIPYRPLFPHRNTSVIPHARAPLCPNCCFTPRLLLSTALNYTTLVEDSVGRLGRGWCVEGSHANGLGVIN